MSLSGGEAMHVVQLPSGKALGTGEDGAIAMQPIDATEDGQKWQFVAVEDPRLKDLIDEVQEPEPEEPEGGAGAEQESGAEQEGGGKTDRASIEKAFSDCDPDQTGFCPKKKLLEQLKKLAAKDKSLQGLLDKVEAGDLIVDKDVFMKDYDDHQ